VLTSCPIRTENLSRSFRGVAALTELSLEVSEGQIYGLIGPNGAGKTTAVKILMNLIRPSTGRAEVLGVESSRLSPRELASIGYISEDLHLPGWMTVEYFLSYLKPFYPTWDNLLSAKMVRDYSLPLGRKLCHLSHGMRMKTALVSSLAYRPRLLILDEPFTGLDPLVRDELIEGMLASAERATILISSHDLNEIESFVSHIGYLEQGRLQFSEDMAALARRFREIEIVVGGRWPSSPSWPKAWMNVERIDSIFRYVDTNFDEDRSMVAIRSLFGDSCAVTAKPMPLRAIFVALAKNARMRE
jgi:ABC-2 type transport system ATP-binding protein